MDRLKPPTSQQTRLRTHGQKRMARTQTNHALLHYFLELQHRSNALLHCCNFLEQASVQSITPSGLQCGPGPGLQSSGRAPPSLSGQRAAQGTSHFSCRVEKWLVSSHLISLAGEVRLQLTRGGQDEPYTGAMQHGEWRGASEGRWKHAISDASRTQWQM